MRLNRGVLGVWISLAMLVLAGGFTSAAFGQSASGNITGTITDTQGAAMVGVMVTAHNADTGVDQRPVMTNESGVYTFSVLPVGTYDITASQAGFNTVQRKGFKLEV